MLIADTSQAKRERIQQFCRRCHTPNYVQSFYRQNENPVLLYNEKFGKPGRSIISEILVRPGHRWQSGQ